MPYLLKPADFLKSWNKVARNDDCNTWRVKTNGGDDSIRSIIRGNVAGSIFSVLAIFTSSHHNLWHHILHFHDFRDLFPVQISRKRSRKLLFSCLSCLQKKSGIISITTRIAFKCPDNRCSNAILSFSFFGLIPDQVRSIPTFPPNSISNFAAIAESHFSSGIWTENGTIQIRCQMPDLLLPYFLDRKKP